MKNKGFTLVELLAIIGIIGIILLVAGPNLKKQMHDREKVDNTILDDKIENASKLYVSKYYADELLKLADGSGSEFTFTLNDLELDGLLELRGKCKNDLENGSKIYVRFSDNIFFDYSELKCKPKK